jgi:hypothetical protein
MAFGMYTTDNTTGSRSLKSRRKIFWQYPSGAAPLMGLLSYLPSEETDKVEFGQYERRFPLQRTATVASGTAPFLNGDGTAFTDTGTMTANTEYIVKVLTTAEFKPTHVIEIREVVYTGGATKSIKGTVTEIVSATQLKFRPYSTTAGVENGSTDNNSKTVVIIGTANQEGGRSGTGITVAPINPTNYTQIFRAAFAISRTALKGGLEYDKSGPYKNLRFENGLRYMMEMEKAFHFGQKHTVNVTDPDTGESTPETKTGGVIYHLEQWEAADSIYRGGTGAAAVTSNDDGDKRIIDAGGTLSRRQLNTYLGRLFKVTNDKAYEKICFCGGTFYDTINTLVERTAVKTVMLEHKGMNSKFEVQQIETSRGTVYFKVHPIYDNDPDLVDAGLFLDLGNLSYRPLTDSDTQFLKGRQETDRDGRKDEWIGEAGLQCLFPESHMFIKNAATAV